MDPKTWTRDYTLSGQDRDIVEILKNQRHERFQRVRVLRRNARENFVDGTSELRERRAVSRSFASRTATGVR